MRGGTFFPLAFSASHMSIQYIYVEIYANLAMPCSHINAHTSLCLIYIGTPGSFGSFGSPAPVMGAPPEEDTEYEVVGVVKTKLLFKERPKPIVSRHLLKS
jgi:hypothetical protein